MEEQKTENTKIKSPARPRGGGSFQKSSSQAIISQQAPLIVTPEQLKIESMKGYLPRRFNVNERVKPIVYNQSKVLEDLQEKIDELDGKYNANDEETNEKKSKDFKSIQPNNTRITKLNEHKSKPLRRQENDYMMFKEIFVQPKEHILTGLKEKEKDFEELFHTGTQRQYDKILHIYDEEKEKSKKIARYNDEDEEKKDVSKSRYTLHQSSLKDDIQLRSGTQQRDLSPQKELEKAIHDNVTLLEQTLHMEGSNQQLPNFFDQQIQVQPPDLPNATIASPLTPGNGYAPSVPLTHNFRDSKTNIKDLLVRAKAGMQAGDIQKEAHLSFYLGMVYESNKNFSEAIKFYKKFFTCARMMEDKIGLALGANRIAVNYFNSGVYDKASEYHKQNIQLSDLENTFAGFYNQGITCRKLKEYEDSIKYFRKSLDWSRQRDEVESECLAYGQLGVTYNEFYQYEEALENFTNCYELSKKLRNTKLQLDCLLSITKITSLTSLKNSDSAIKVLKDAVDCAKSLGDKKTASICICNLGVLEGGKNYQEFSLAVNLDNDIY